VDSEILHSGEGGDVEQWLEPRNKSILFAIILFVSLFHLLAFFSSFFPIVAHLNKKAIEHLNSYLEE